MEYGFSCQHLVDIECVAFTWHALLLNLEGQGRDHQMCCHQWYACWWDCL